MTAADRPNNAAGGASRSTYAITVDDITRRCVRS
jgi:hypothetical protein